MTEIVNMLLRMAKFITSSDWIATGE